MQTATSDQRSWEIRPPLCDAGTMRATGAVVPAGVLAGFDADKLLTRPVGGGSDLRFRVAYGSVGPKAAGLGVAR